MCVCVCSSCQKGFFSFQNGKYFHLSERLRLQIVRILLSFPFPWSSAARLKIPHTPRINQLDEIATVDEKKWMRRYFLFSITKELPFTPPIFMDDCRLTTLQSTLLTDPSVKKLHAKKTAELSAGTKLLFKSATLHISEQCLPAMVAQPIF